MPPSSEISLNLSLKAMDLPENIEPDNPLWRFALTFWQLSAAQESCLALQNEGWSVTRILCAGWLALKGCVYTGTEDAKVTEWRDRVTGSLRAIRTCVPKAQAPYDVLRKNLTNLELESERIELALAWRTLTVLNPEPSDMQEPGTLIRHNLAAAAPEHGMSMTARPLLSALSDALITIYQGDT